MSSVPKGGTDRVPLVPIPIVSSYAGMGHGLCSPFDPPSSSEKRYILMLIDAETKWSESVAMTSQSADKVADEMITIFSRLRFLRVILSDLGLSFKSELLTKFERELWIKPMISTLYHHQSLSSSERYIGTWKNMLSNLCQMILGHGTK